MAAITPHGPEPHEYPPHFEKYVSLVRQPDVTAALSQQLLATRSLLDSITENMALTRYDPDKWSIKEVLGHMTDTERIMSYRALRIARGDKTPLASFEQDDYVRMAEFDKRTWDSLKNEFEIVRHAAIALFSDLPSDAWTRMGTSGEKAISVRALAHIIAGHELYHLEILRTRYLTNAAPVSKSSLQTSR